MLALGAMEKRAEPSAGGGALQSRRSPQCALSRVIPSAGRQAGTGLACVPVSLLPEGQSGHEGTAEVRFSMPERPIAPAPSVSSSTSTGGDVPRILLHACLSWSLGEVAPNLHDQLAASVAAARLTREACLQMPQDYAG